MKRIFNAVAVLCFIFGITANAAFIKTNTYSPKSNYRTIL